MQVDNDKVFFEILKELREINKTNKENSVVLKQVSQYLRDHQAVIDFQLKDSRRQNQLMMKEMKNLIMKAAVLSNPNLAQVYRLNNTIVSSYQDPVNTLSENILTAYAEASYQQVYDAAYYRVGYYSGLGTSFSPINDGVPELMNQTQTLTIESTIAADKGTTPAGNGVRMVLVGGLDANGYRMSEPVVLNGITAVTTTNQFSQIDLFSTILTGSSASAVGTITAKGSIDTTTTYALIQPTNNSWRSGRFFTDTKAAAYIDQWSFSATDTVRGQLRVDATPGGYYAMITQSTCFVSNGTAQLTFPIPIRALSSGLVMVRGVAKNSGSGIEVTTAFALHFITNPPG